MDPKTSIVDLAESGMDARGVGLVGDILFASSQSIQRTQDRLWEAERKRRMVLEMQIEAFLDAAERAHMGSTREYEAAIDVLRYPKPDSVLLSRHPDFTPDDL